MRRMLHTWRMWRTWRVWRMMHAWRMLHMSDAWRMLHMRAIVQHVQHVTSDDPRLREKLQPHGLRDARARARASARWNFPARELLLVTCSKKFQLSIGVTAYGTRARAGAGADARGLRPPSGTSTATRKFFS